MKYFIIILHMKNLRFRDIQWFVTAMPQLNVASPDDSLSPWSSLALQQCLSGNGKLWISLHSNCLLHTSTPPALKLLAPLELFLSPTKPKNFSWVPYSLSKLKTLYLFPLQRLNTSNHVKSCQFSLWLRLCLPPLLHCHWQDPRCTHIVLETL